MELAQVPDPTGLTFGDTAEEMDFYKRQYACLVAEVERLQDQRDNLEAMANRYLESIRELSVTDQTSPEQDRLAVFEKQLETTLGQLVETRMGLAKVASKVQNAEEIVKEVRRALPLDDDLRKKLLTAETLLGMALIDAEKASES